MGDLTELVVNIVNWSVIYRTGQLFTGQIFTGQLFTGQIFTGQIFTGLVRTSDWSDIYWSVIYWSDNYLTTGQISYRTQLDKFAFKRMVNRMGIPQLAFKGTANWHYQLFL